MRQQIASMVLTLVVVFCSTLVSATMWFQQSFDDAAPENPYEVRLELVRDLNKPFVGDNVLWTSGIIGVQYLDEVATVPETETAHLVVANVYGYETSVLYEVELMNGKTPLFSCTLDATGKKSVLKRGTSSVFENIDLQPEKGTELRFVLRTASVTQSIYTASSFADLNDKEYPLKSVVYAAGDIVATGDMEFTNRYCNLNLMGHTLKCDSLTLAAAKDKSVFLGITNGSVIIGEKRYTAQDTIPCKGEGQAVFSLQDLK